MDGDYIKDENAARLKIAIAELERCGVQYGGSKERIDRLAWFVGGDPQQIRELQKMLNELGIEGERGRLKVDGVYSPDTHFAWLSFLNRLENGTVPTLAWINPLQPKVTKITIGATTTGKAEGLSNAFLYDNKQRVFHADPPHLSQTATINGKKVLLDYNHINFEAVGEPNPLYSEIIKKYNHAPITEDAYKALTHMKEIGKQVRVAGKVLFMAGVALDALELGLAIHVDLKNPDEKFAQRTASTLAGISGRWAGAIVGAKVGAAFGAAAISAIPCPATVILGAGASLVLGIVGAFSGDEFARWLLDVSCLED